LFTDGSQDIVWNTETTRYMEIVGDCCVSKILQNLHDWSPNTRKKFISIYMSSFWGTALTFAWPYFWRFLSVERLKLPSACTTNWK